jgi:putative endonuclease
MRSALQQQGDAGEKLALDFLIKKGLKPIARNVSSPLGEIDLLMQDADQWVFIEVRQRKSMRFGGAAASISSAKQLKLRRQAQKVLQDHFGKHPWPSVRFDVIAIEGSVEDGRINWIPSAF